MLLAIDAGNTQIKWAVFEQNTLAKKEAVTYNDWKSPLKNILINFPNIKNIVVSSVGRLNKGDFFELFSTIRIEFISNASKFPFKNLYTTPQTLGVDRMILASGAVLQFPNKNRLIIDAGTCITYDFIDKNNNYLGGAISPGLKLRYESLHNYTAKLPLLTKQIPKQLIGDSTDQAIHSGIINGIVMEIDGYISSNLKIYDNFIIILTGGDTDFLAERLKNTIFANSNFLLESLNRTFQYQQQ